MKISLFVVTAILLVTNISYSSIEKPATREEYEQKIQQQQEKTEELQTLTAKQKKELLDLKWKIYHAKYDPEPNKVEIEKTKITIKKQAARIIRVKELCRRVGIDPNSDPNDIKPGVRYSILNDVTLDTTHALTVQLNRKVSEAKLRSIALELRARYPRDYEYTLIHYYIRGMRTGVLAWATTHFTPDLKVVFIGLTIEQEESLKQLPDDNPSREIIGNWFDESATTLGAKITLFRQNSKLFIENTYRDGGIWKQEIAPNLSGKIKGKRFWDKERNESFGEFYLIDPQGDLQLWDKDGLIFTAKKINR